MLTLKDPGLARGFEGIVLPHKAWAAQCGRLSQRCIHYVPNMCCNNEVANRTPLSRRTWLVASPVPLMKWSTVLVKPALLLFRGSSTTVPRVVTFEMWLGLTTTHNFGYPTSCNNTAAPHCPHAKQPPSIAQTR